MTARVDTLGFNAQIDNDTDSLQSEEESDVEAQLEAFMAQAIQSSSKGNIAIRESQQSAEDMPTIKEARRELQMPDIDVFKEQNEFDPVFKVLKN